MLVWRIIPVLGVSDWMWGWFALRHPSAPLGACSPARGARTCRPPERICCDPTGPGFSLFATPRPRWGLLPCEGSTNLPATRTYLERSHPQSPR